MSCSCNNTDVFQDEQWFFPRCIIIASFSSRNESCFVSQGSSQLTVLLPILEVQSFLCAHSQPCLHSSTPPWQYLVCSVELPCLIITAPTITFHLRIIYEASEIYFLIHTVIYFKISELQRLTAVSMAIKYDVSAKSSFIDLLLLDGHF